MFSEYTSDFARIITLSDDKIREEVARKAAHIAQAAIYYGFPEPLTDTPAESLDSRSLLKTAEPEEVN